MGAISVVLGLVCSLMLLHTFEQAIPPKRQQKNHNRSGVRTGRSKTFTSSAYSLVNRARPSQKAVFPERYVTSITNSINCYFPAGFLTAAAGNYASILVNGLGSPYNSATYQLTTAPGPAYAFHASLVQGNTLAQAGMGYSALAALYVNYKVLSYTLKATFMPQNVGDTTEMVLVPVGLEEIPFSAAASVDLRVMAAQPRSVARVCEVSVPAIANTLRLSQDMYHLTGQRKSQYLDLPPIAVGSNPAPGSQAYVGIFLQQLNGANSGAVCTLALELTQVVEFTDFLNPI